MKNLKNQIMLAALLGVPALTLAKPALAQFDTGLDSVETDLSGTSLPTLLGRGIDTILGLVGIVLFLIVLYAGFLWMTAGGNEDKVGEAKKWLLNAVIGLVLVFAAYAISAYFIDDFLGNIF